MVKSKKNNLTFILKISLKAKPKKSGSFIIVNGKKIPLNSSNKSRRNKVSSKRGAKKASSTNKKRVVSSKSGKRMLLQRKAPKKAVKKTAKLSSALMKKKAASFKTVKGKSLQKKDLKRSRSSKVLKTKAPAPAKKIMPSLDDIKEFFGVKDKTQKKVSKLQSSSASAPAKQLMPSSSTREKKVSFDLKDKAHDSNSLQSSSNGSENSGPSKTIYMPIKQESNGQNAEAIVVEDKEEKADLQNVKLVVKAEKKN